MKKTVRKSPHTEQNPTGPEKDSKKGSKNKVCNKFIFTIGIFFTSLLHPKAKRTFRAGDEFPIPLLFSSHTHNERRTNLSNLFPYFHTGVIDRTPFRKVERYASRHTHTEEEEKKSLIEWKIEI